MSKIFKVPFADQGDKEVIPVTAQPDGKVSYATGYTPDYEKDLSVGDPTAKPVERTSMNQLFNVITTALAEIQIGGAANWSVEGKPYPINASVRHNDKLWLSLANDNEDEPAEGLTWTEFSADLVKGKLDKSAVKQVFGQSEEDVVSQKTISDAISSSSVFVKPKLNRPLFDKVSPSSIKIPAGFAVSIGNSLIVLDADLTLTLSDNLDTGVKVPGTDYYVYLKPNGTGYISTNKEKVDARLIGGFHYGLTAELEAASGNKTNSDMTAIRGINAHSLWDLNWRPMSCGAEGMVYSFGKWWDIYPTNSDHIVNGTSKAGAWIAGGAITNGRQFPKIPLQFGGDGSLNYGKLSWYQALEIGASHGKELISAAEYPNIAYGVLEGKSAATDGYQIVAGKVEHYPQLTSSIGIEQAAGVQYVWGSDTGVNRTTDVTQLFEWQDIVDGRGKVHSPNQYAVTAVSLAGYSASAAAASGSRCASWNNRVQASSWDVGCRFSAPHLKHGGERDSAT